MAAKALATENQVNKAPAESGVSRTFRTAFTCENKTVGN